MIKLKKQKWIRILIILYIIQISIVAITTSIPISRRDYGDIYAEVYLGTGQSWVSFIPVLGISSALPPDYRVIFNAKNWSYTFLAEAHQEVDLQMWDVQTKSSTKLLIIDRNYNKIYTIVGPEHISEDVVHSDKEKGTTPDAQD